MRTPDQGGSHWLRVFLGTLTVTSAAALPLTLLSVLSPWVTRELGLGERGFGLLLSLYPIATAISAIPAGRFVDSVGWKVPLTTGGGASFVALLALGAAPPRTWLLSLALVIGGIGQAFVVASGGVLLAFLRAPMGLGLSLGTKQTALPLTTALGGAIAPSIALAAGWRLAALTFLAIPAMGLALTLPMRVKRMNEPNTGTRRPEAHPLTRSATLCVGAAATAAATGVVSFFALFATGAGLSGTAAGAVLSVGAAGSVSMRIGLGALVDRRQVSPRTISGVALIVGSSGLALMATSTLGGQLVVGGLLAQVGLGSWSGLYMLMAVEGSAQEPGSGVGLATLGLFAGTALGPILVGTTTAGLGYRSSWWLCTALALLAAAVLLVGRQTDRPTLHAAR